MNDEQDITTIKMPLSYWEERMDTWGITPEMIQKAQGREDKVIAYSQKQNSYLVIGKQPR